MANSPTASGAPEIDGLEDGARAVRVGEDRLTAGPPPHHNRRRATPSHIRVAKWYDRKVRM
jgi:hypothetical protein